ncbi:AP-3 complex subunit delta-1-like isoform X2 [Homarus americanus]|uniref:AP-3 complex subunit delta-1-like isoform X2 n=1 Tax=Homarus americanus TaxID=6706 RepID=UPI001C478642|nr:AP-3 complex subunit delta-1-like isoform X2 [Homarus americanus]
MALRKVKGNLERMFDKNLTDLVRGIRNNKETESKYISQCMEEIKTELRQDNLAVKANAVAKLTYLQMLGYDISWAGFNIIEVMSSPKFTYKRIGYLSASQCFHQDTEVLMLTTNMIRKDLNSHNMYDSGTALTGLACFISGDLARDLANDVMTLLTSTKPYLRKKAVLLLYKVFLKFPEALRPAFPRLKEKLEDPDPGVQSAAVNVICELARKNPKNYLSLAPVFFKLMTSSTNNWMLIKIIKLFGALTPLEPRLGKKLIEPLTNLIHSTSAMSLLYECINTVIAVLISISSGMPNHNASIQLCVQKLRILIEDSDQNLKYLGLLAMSKILKTHPKSVQAHKDLVLQCLDDKDESIRLRALDLLYGMVTKKTVMEIVRRLMTHMDRAEGTMYRDELLQKIILICSQNNFQYITNFEWYISVLVELCRMEGTQHGGLIASQLMDVAIRVVAVREFTVGQMALLLDNAHVIVGPAAARSSIAEVLYAAAWICGEFSQLLANPKATLESMVRGKVVSLPGHIQAIYVHNMLKLYAHIIATAEEEDDSEMIEEVTTLLLERLPVFVSSGDLEVQERASCIVHVVTYVQKCHKNGDKVGVDLIHLMTGELNPVAPKAQKKVPLPDGLDLDVWINDPPSESEEEEDDAFKKEIFVKAESSSRHKKEKYEPSEEELQKLRDARRAEQASNPYYVKSSAQTSPRPNHNSIQIDEIPVAAIDLNVSLKIPGMTSLDKYQLVDGWQDGSKKRHKKQKKRSKRKGPLTSSSDEEIRQAHVVNTDVGEMPEGAHFSDDNEVDDRPEDDPHRALDIDLDEPLAPNEVLPTRTHYEVHSQKTPEESNEANLQPSQTPTKKKSKNKKDKKEKKEKTKKVKKEQKKVKKKFTGNEENLILDLMDSVKVAAISDETPVAANHINGITDAKNKEKPTDDLDFWLSKDDSSSQAPSEPIVDGTERTASPSSYPSGRDESKSKKTKTKKEKKAKKEKGKDKSEKKKSRKREKVEDSSIRNREEYEETNGTVTQDLEDKPVIPTVQPNNRLLAEDSFLRLDYSTAAMDGVMSEVLVCIKFTNHSSKSISKLQLMLPDSSALKMIRNDPQSELVNLPWTLDPGESKESQLSFTAEDDTIPDKLRGSLSYIQDGTSSSDLSLRLEFPVTTFLSGKTASRATFTDLLSSGQLSARSSFTIPECPWSFPEVLEEVTRGGSLAVVESVDQTASLYGRSLHGHHVCLLVKYQASSRLTVDGKSTEGILLSNALDHLKTVLMQKQ